MGTAAMRRTDESGAAIREAGRIADAAAVPASYAAGEAWHIASCFCDREERLARAMRKDGFAVYRPVVSIVRRYRNRHVHHSALPMFPGYLFVLFDPARAPDARRWRNDGMEGFLARVGSPDVPAQLPNGAIAAIMMAEHELAKRAGVVTDSARRKVNAVEKSKTMTLDRKAQKRAEIWGALERDLTEAQPERWVAILMGVLQRQELVGGRDQKQA